MAARDELPLAFNRSDTDRPAFVVCSRRDEQTPTQLLWVHEVSADAGKVRVPIGGFLLSGAHDSTAYLVCALVTADGAAVQILRDLQGDLGSRSGLQAQDGLLLPVGATAIGHLVGVRMAPSGGEPAPTGQVPPSSTISSATPGA